MSLTVAVDIGGTFTDLAAYLPAEQRLVYAKSPTTHGDLARGVMACVAQAGLALSEAGTVKHGTTIVINTLLERTGAKVALVATHGFRDTLEAGRGNRPEAYDLFFKRDDPLVSRQHRYEALERIDGKGEVLQPLDLDQLATLAHDLRNEGFDAVAISFMNAYRNPDHESAAKEHLAALLPDTFITTGTDLSREWYEFERTSTAVANAYVGPRVEGYLNRLERDLRAEDFAGQFFLLASNGGVLSAQVASQIPLHLVESGPVGGCIGTAAMANQLGIANAIAFDMGGTTAKCALVEHGSFAVEHRYDIGGYARGFPIQVPVVDIVEVGAGGGSIAWLDAVNALHVGPRSAGSNPGPSAYGWGGTLPTVTDANTVLGRLAPDSFLGGTLRLDPDAAATAVRENITNPLEMHGPRDVERMALGILSIATVIMAGAIKRITVERGRDPRDYVLFAYGGAGPLHATELARELHIPTVIVPPEPGNFSATGMLLAEVRRDHARTFVALLDDEVLGDLKQAYDDLATEARTALREEFGTTEIAVEHKAEIRYRGQQHTVLTPISDLDSVDAIRSAYELAYRKRYGHTDALSAIEIVNLLVTAVGAIDRPDPGLLVPRLADTSTHSTTRSVVLPDSKAAEAVEVAIYDRSRLPPGFQADGPAIVEEYGSTTLIGRNDRFEVGSLGELRVHIGMGEAA